MSNCSLSQQEAASAYLQRKAARGSMTEWSRYVGYEPALHHRVLIACLEKAASVPDSKFIFCLPPGTAKSTYASCLFPPWFVAQPVPPWLADKQPGDAGGRTILACSHSANLVTSFGRRCRNNIDLHGRTLGISLSSHTKASDEWETTNGGRYFAAGVGAGIAGHRADLGLIDDFCGSEQDADSETLRESTYNWYLGDFLPRLRPGASQVIVATRRHEKDLIGRILETEAGLWVVIKIPWTAKANDPLGRAVGERIWPEYTTEEMERRARKKARIFSGQYQQEPTPDDGDFFQESWLRPYEPVELPTNLRIYICSDHAISKKEEADKSCFMAHGVDSSGQVWVLPRLVWSKLSSKEQVDAMFSMAGEMLKRYGNCTWVAEKCHISDCLAPYIATRRDESGVRFHIIEYVSKRDKRTRAGAVQGYMEDGLVRYPVFAPWWPDARRELLGFDNLGEDDFVDAHSLMGRHLDAMRAPHALVEDIEVGEPLWTPEALTPRWLRGELAYQEAERAALLADN